MSSMQLENRAVTIHGLRSVRGSALNGETGRIIGWSLDWPKRWLVEVTGLAVPMAIKPINLKYVDNATPETAGIPDMF